MHGEAASALRAFKHRAGPPFSLPTVFNKVLGIVQCPATIRATLPDSALGHLTAQVWSYTCSEPPRAMFLRPETVTVCSASNGLLLAFRCLIFSTTQVGFKYGLIEASPFGRELNRVDQFLGRIPGQADRRASGRDLPLDQTPAHHSLD